jgi:hypothetical protein
MMIRRLVVTRPPLERRRPFVSVNRNVLDRSTVSRARTAVAAPKQSMWDGILDINRTRSGCDQPNYDWIFCTYRRKGSHRIRLGCHHVPRAAAFLHTSPEKL